MQPPASIEIDLDAIVHNVAAARRLLAPGTRLYGVVKGDAYGAGHLAAAEALAEAGVDALAAGDVHEALAIRGRLPELPILVYGTYEPDQIPSLAAAGLWPTLFSAECVEAAIASGRPITALLEVDCGFGRLGLLEAEVAGALERVRACPNLTLRGLYTHLGAVEDAEIVARQAAQFGRIVDLAARQGFPGLETMVASSRVMLGFPELGLGAVNPGRLLYGLLEGPWRDRVALRPAFASVTSRLIQVKDLLPGARLGYGAFAGPDDRVIRAGIAAIGFAHGLPRTMSGAPVLVRGRRARVLGLASMEHLLIDIEGVPDATAGDEVVLIGRQRDEAIDGEAFAAAVGLTELEILPRLGRGLPRRYRRHGSIVADP